MTEIEPARSLADKTLLVIRESIIDGTLTPGLHLVQEDLAAQLGVSRQPVQQSLVRLKSEGFVVERGNRGLYVAPLDPGETKARFQIRVALEQVAVREATLRAARDPALARQFQAEGARLIDAGNRLVAENRLIEAVTRDTEFHAFLCRASGNRLLQSTLEVHSQYIRRVMIAVVLIGNRGPLVWDEHRQILEAVCAGQIEEAVGRITVHVYGSSGAMVDALRHMGADDGHQSRPLPPIQLVDGAMQTAAARSAGSP